MCTAEVLANSALGEGDGAGFGFACLDEFHYYGEADRGGPGRCRCSTLRRCQFLMASATLGDMNVIADRSRRAHGPRSR